MSGFWHWLNTPAPTFVAGYLLGSLVTWNVFFRRRHAERNATLAPPGEPNPPDYNG